MLYLQKATRMKRTLLFIAFMSLTFAENATAKTPIAGKVTKAIPKFTLGVKVGANFQELNSKADFKQGYNAGLMGGLFAGVHWSKVGIKAEGLVKSASFAYTDGTTSIGQGNVDVVYLDVPVLFEFNILPRLWVQVGPQFSDMLSAKSNGNDVQSRFKTTDFSGVLGLEAKLPLHFSVGARYILGFADINNHSVANANETWNNRSIQLFVGFRFI